MPVVDREVFRRRLDALRSYLDRLDAVADDDRATFVAERDRRKLAVR
jgi:hypothetical protein